MKKIVSKAALGLLVGGAVLSAFAGGPDVPPAPMVTPGFYIGAGGSWNTIDAENNYHQIYTFTSDGTGYVKGDTIRGSDKVHYLHRNRLAPMFQAGYWAPIDSEWLWGLQANYKYLNHVDTSDLVINNNRVAARGTGYGKFKLEHELLLLAYFGMQFSKGYAYLGAGPAAFWVTDGFVLAGLSTAGNGTSPTVVSSRTFEKKKTLWGGAAQIGWNYYFKPTWFLSFSYTYALSSKKTFTLYDGKSGSFNQEFDATHERKADDVSLTSDKCVTVQEVMFSLNKVFAF
jgi:hypothetical protein